MPLISKAFAPGRIFGRHSRSQRRRRKRRGAFFWKTASWCRSARISACRAARVRKLDATKAKKGDEKRAHQGSHYDLTNDRNLFVFRYDGIFGNRRLKHPRVLTHVAIILCLPERVNAEDCSTPRERRVSLGQADAAKHSLEPRVRAQKIEFGSGFCLKGEVIFLGAQRFV